MTDFSSFGGSDEENAEIKRLKTEVVGLLPALHNYPYIYDLLILMHPIHYRKPIPIALKTGRS